MTAGTRVASSRIDSKLDDLRHHWGSAFRIEFSYGRWRAEWRDGRSPAKLSAETDGELRQMIRDEYRRLTRIRLVR